MAVLMAGAMVGRVIGADIIPITQSFLKSFRVRPHFLSFAPASSAPPAESNQEI
jgi:hypothetical protein